MEEAEDLKVRKMEAQQRMLGTRLRYPILRANGYSDLPSENTTERSQALKSSIWYTSAIGT